jgi:RNA polymerase sigma factor (sigma-70 family)
VKGTIISDESATRNPALDSPDEKFAQLLREFHSGLARLTAAYESVPESREDLLQDIFMALWLALPKFRGQSSLRTFVYRIAHNRALTHVWRRKRSAPMEPIDDDALMDTKPGPERAAIAAGDRDHLLRAIRELPLGLRQVISLALEDLPNAEISAVLGITENNVAVRLTRARAVLRNRMRRNENVRS